MISLKTFKAVLVGFVRKGITDKNELYSKVKEFVSIPPDFGEITPTDFEETTPPDFGGIMPPDLGEITPVISRRSVGKIN